VTRPPDQIDADPPHPDSPHPDSIDPGTDPIAPESDARNRATARFDQQFRKRQVSYDLRHDPASTGDHP
jgi:hypothetical protein